MAFSTAKSARAYTTCVFASSDGQFDELSYGTLHEGALGGSETLIDRTGIRVTIVERFGATNDIEVYANEPLRPSQTDILRMCT